MLAGTCKKQRGAVTECVTAPTLRGFGRGLVPAAQFLNDLVCNCSDLARLTSSRGIVAPKLAGEVALFCVPSHPRFLKVNNIVHRLSTFVIVAVHKAKGDIERCQKMLFANLQKKVSRK
jgi:hypothetical protein